MEVKNIKVSDLIPYVNNARTHSAEQVKYIKHYAVTESGVIVMLDHKYINRWGGTSIRKEKKLSYSNDKDGYKLVTMNGLGWTKNGQVRVHRLIAHVWHGECPNGLEVNHKDGNKSNNHADNLEYVTSKENKKHAVEMGLFHTGRKHHRTKQIKLTKGKDIYFVNGVREIVAMGFHAPSVHRVARGERRLIHGWSAEYV